MVVRSGSRAHAGSPHLTGGVAALHRRQPRTPWALAAGLVLSLGLAACGTALDPAEVARSSVGGDGAARPSVSSTPGAPLATDGGLAAGPRSGADVDLGAGGTSDTSDLPPAQPGAPADDEPVDGPAAPPEGRPDSPVEAADCAGLQNSTGITDTTITIGNASDISGPVPGLFESAQIAVKAYVAYFNASGETICGRKLAVKSYDTRTDAAADQQAYASGCTEVFAMVGSMSGFDSGGAATAEKCGIPDIRAIATTAVRSSCATCYAVQPAGSDEFQNAVPDFIKRTTGGQKAAMLYLSAGAAAENGPSQADFGTRRGMKYVYIAGVDTSEFNYVPFVRAMMDKGVTSVQFVAAGPYFVRLVQTMQQQNFEPELVLLDPTAYSTKFTEPSGTAGVGVVSYLNFLPFEEAATNAEMNLYLKYIQQIKPGTEADFFGVFAWSAARLFVEQAIGLGDDLTRSSLIAATRSVDSWTANGMHGPMRVAAKKSPECWRFVQWSGDAWKALDGRKYQCSGTSRR